MKRHIKSITAGCFAVFMVSSTSFAQNTILTGDLKGLKEKQIVVQYKAGAGFKSDTVKLKEGKFTWKADMKGPNLVYIMMSNKYYQLFAQPGKMTLTGIKDSTASYVVKGSKMQDESNDYEKSIAHISEQENEFFKNYQKMDSLEKIKTETKLDELSDQRKIIADDYIKKHPGSDFSVYLITSRASHGSDYSDIKKLYDVLNDQVKQTPGGIELAERMEVLKRSAIGAEMIDFTQNDTAGNAVRFASLKGKYMLVDFWASWCGPCRAENPNVLKAYDKYKDKNFTVLGISLDDKGTNWKKAIRDDKMPWVQLSDLKGWKNEVSNYYGIQSIPSNLLIDPSGKIIARDLRGQVLQSKLEELLN